MRYFQRQALKPHIQNQLDAKTSTNWNSLADAQRDEIVAKLLVAQKQICAYCECEISAQNRHIEHFEERHDAPAKTFHYTNLLL